MTGTGLARRLPYFPEGGYRLVPRFQVEVDEPLPGLVENVRCARLEDQGIACPFGRRCGLIFGIHDDLLRHGDAP